ncbi:MAG: pyroglutamyl-peptidase I [Myxococcota bacterium]
MSARSKTVVEAPPPRKKGRIALFTAFEPFGGLEHNPSAAALARLPEHIAGRPVVSRILPVSTSDLDAALEVLPFDDADVVIMTGVALERPVLSIERVALNLLDFDRPDNQGRAPQDRPIEEDAPLALASRLPVRAILKAWEAAGIPAKSSSSAGTYLCNQAFFLGLRADYEGPLGFIHVAPDEVLLRTRAASFYQPLEVTAHALALAAETVLAGLAPARAP